jgi:murein DD-endopeptidase MepM/ murein hydrolase activator NlpD
MGIVLLHPIVRVHFVCLDHSSGQLKALGDALASDCVVLSLAGGPLGRWPVFYRNSGLKNEDWYGWRATVLAPFDGIVDSVHINITANEPGTLGRDRASVIVFRGADGTRVLYAHVQDIQVKPGDRVISGQPVAKVGNNGPAWFPHTHVGAWKANSPLQVRFDPIAMGKLRWMQ